jgi:hypothetical protein
LKVINSVEHGWAGEAGLKLELGSFGREKELRVAKILNTRRVSGDMQNLFPDAVETFRLQKVMQILLSLVTGVSDLPILHLTGIAISQSVSVTGREMLHIVDAMLLVYRGMKDPVQPARELLISQANKLGVGDREVGKKNVERNVGGALDTS